MKNNMLSIVLLSLLCSSSICAMDTAKELETLKLKRAVQAKTLFWARFLFGVSPSTPASILDEIAWHHVTAVNVIMNEITKETHASYEAREHAASTKIIRALAASIGKRAHAIYLARFKNPHVSDTISELIARHIALKITDNAYADGESVRCKPLSFYTGTALTRRVENLAKNAVIIFPQFEYTDRRIIDQSCTQMHNYYQTDIDSKK